MKNPLMLPSYLCGECGIEMLLTSAPTQERAATKSVTASCYTPRCAQRGVAYTLPLVEVAGSGELQLEPSPAT